MVHTVVPPYPVQFNGDEWNVHLFSAKPVYICTSHMCVSNFMMNVFNQPYSRSIGYNALRRLQWLSFFFFFLCCSTRSMKPPERLEFLGVLLVFLCTGFSAELAFKVDSEWQTWKEKHDRDYENEIHELERYVIWKSNKAYIDAHNELEEEFGYRLALNQFADMVSRIYMFLVQFFFST